MWGLDSIGIPFGGFKFPYNEALHPRSSSPESHDDFVEGMIPLHPVPLCDIVPFPMTNEYDPMVYLRFCVKCMAWFINSNVHP